MKKHTIPLLIGWLLLLNSNLIAQNKEGRFKLKEGDWFEIEVEQTSSGSITISDIKQEHVDNTIFLLHYQLIKEWPNKDQQYRISLEHRRIMKKLDARLYGNDSYYPDYDENRNAPITKSEFTFKVTPEGKVSELVSIKNNSSANIIYTEIRQSTSAKGPMGYSESNSDSLLFTAFSQILMQIHPTTNDRVISKSGIPILIEQQNLKITLADASFILPHNSLIHGKLNDQINQEITISLNGENPEYNFPEKRFKTGSDGSFECPIFIKRPVHLKVKVGNKSLTTFMEPGDTLKINAIGHQAREIYYHQYVETKPNEYYSQGIAKSDYFSGNAAYNTMLSNEMDQYRDGFVNLDDVSAVIKKEEEIKQAVNQLIESYRGKASDHCLEYFQMDFQYFLAVSKFYFKEQQEIPSFDAQGKYIGLKKVAYTKDFFLAVDTMPILMKRYEWNSFYQDFIKKSQVYKQSRLGISVGKMATDNFMENYYFSMVSLKGYPLYQQIAYSMDLELRKGSDVNNIQPYYDNFLTNCGDPALTEPLKKVYHTAERFKIGNQFPFNSFVLNDSTNFNLENLKGKPICIVLLDRRFRVYDHLVEAINKFKTDEVTFLLIKATDVRLKENITDSALLNLPNVKYIEVPEKFLKTELLLDFSRIFMLDKWFRIVENNAEDPMTHIYQGGISQFEISLRKAIDAKRYSKAEESAIIKTAGWSLGSILFTLLVGFGIYRIRIRQIKQQEEAKRRIKELEIKAIRSQMNPHFIFNALNSIQSLINGNQFKEANIYLSKFAVLLRGVLNNSEKGMVSLSDELKAVELYCQLEQLRFDFNFDISIAEDVNGDLIEIPGMIIQPLAENAVVHGISAKGDQGKLGILVIRQKEHICIEVSDNGVGLSPQDNDSLRQKGFGLKLVEERINILNLEGKEARLTVRNIGKSSGTLATLIIPID